MEENTRHKSQIQKLMYDEWIRLQLEEPPEVTANEVRNYMLDKLHEERTYWRMRLHQQQSSAEKAMFEIKKASNLLLSAVVKACGKPSTKEDVYILSIPMPEDGYYTAGFKQGGKYILRCAPKIEI